MGLVDGESVAELARRLSIDTVEAQEILDRMKRKLRVTRAASAVRIRLIASASL